MTVSTTTYTITYAGNGATTAFTFPFIGVAAADIEVALINQTTLAETVLSTTQYSLALNVAATGQLWGIGGTVTYPTSGTAMAVGTSIKITRILPYTQTISISNQGSFYPQTIEQALDKLELQIQQVEGQVAPLATAVTDAQTAAAGAVVAEVGAIAAETAAAVYAASAQSGATGNQGRNRLINGDMRFDQRNAGATVTPSVSDYSLDRFYVSLLNAPTVTVGRNYGGVTPPVGFSYYLGIKTTTTATVAASDQNTIRQYIEGGNIADWNWGTASAKTVTLSFWAYSSMTGQFGGSLRNSPSTYSYPFAYTINAANTWELKTVTITGPLLGVWVTAPAATAGCILNFSLGTGSTRTAAAGAWAVGDYVNSTGSNNIIGTLNATLYLTGIQIEVGATATAFEVVDYATMLNRCQRYYQVLGGVSTSTYFTGAAYSATAAIANVPYNVTMRLAPAVITLPAAGTASGQMLFLLADSTNPGVIGIHTPTVGVNYMNISASGYTGAWAAGNAVLLNVRPTSVIRLDAEF